MSKSKTDIIPKLDPKTDGCSLDILGHNIQQMRELFPEVFTEGSDEDGPRWKVDMEALGELLGEYVENKQERYSFNWHGKARAKRIAQTPSTGTLRPCPEESVNWDTTKNIFIEGDNLEVLKLLQKSYHKKVKMIYIDPPYNTGKDFIYPDKFGDNLDTYLKYTGQVDGDGLKISANSETGGRYHTNWLNMMYPRLKLARNLLRDDGVIFISIDDHEVQHLTMVCNEIFGEENWVGTIIWKNATDNNPSRVVVEHEYVLVYAKSIENSQPVWRTKISDIKKKLTAVGDEFIKKYTGQEERQDEYTKWFRENKAFLWPLDRYKYIDEDGIYIGSQSVHNPGREGYRYDVIHPKTNRPCKQPLMGYRFPESTMERLLAEERILFGADENKIIELKVYVEEFEDKFSSFVSLDGRLGAYDLTRLFDDCGKIFTNPKPVKFLQQLFGFVLEDGEIALDFFAGSGGTAEAVTTLNESDGGARRYILAQLPEALEDKNETGKNAKKAGFTTIAGIAKERCRRTIPNHKENVELGFRVFKLDSTNLLKWDSDGGVLEQQLFDAKEHIKDDREDDDILFELLLKYGLDLSTSVSSDSAGNSIIAGGALVVALASPDAEKIAELKDELQPELMRVVFKDSGFKDDVAKTNAIQILRQRGIEDIKTI